MAPNEPVVGETETTSYWDLPYLNEGGRSRSRGREGHRNSLWSERLTFAHPHQGLLVVFRFELSVFPCALLRPLPMAPWSRAILTASHVGRILAKVTSDIWGRTINHKISLTGLTCLLVITSLQFWSVY